MRVADANDVDALFIIRTSVKDNHLSIAEMAEMGITHETLPSMLNGPGRGWVAECDGKAVAFAMADVEDATVFAMFVLPEYEGMGVGRLLMGEAEAWLFDNGCKEIWLSTDSDQQVRSNGFYRHLGWLASGTLEDGQTKFIKRAVA
ncbi:GNAT family N-acetyltransferase [Chromobacterium haemolyticum]|nr:GNAT family N-acetyltransferase [Chromobacterium haemolyticum]